MTSSTPQQANLNVCTHLILICCHAVYTGDGIAIAEENWNLASFQRSSAPTNRPSEHTTLLAHISAGAIATEQDPSALMIFSGGATNPSTTLSEAQGYERLFLSSPFFPATAFPGARERYALEPAATDSFQNLLFSLLRFRALVGRWPAYITVVTHAFKARRFVELHAPALKWPLQRLRVHGISPPFSKAELEGTVKGEETRGFQPFVGDLYGVRGSLAEKRRARGWSEERLDELAEGIEEEVVRELVFWTGGESGCEVFPGRLPWEDGL